ncbi:DNA recombination protein RmuC [Candidatus Uhrbacteria bacterium]|jgi:DNA recombination protein RmuC|nr:DNA recombination protein RmuC [Candidatus Uhrbacteria bacterium]
MNELLYIFAGVAAGAVIVYLTKRGSSQNDDVSQNVNQQLQTLREELQRTNSDQRREVQEQLQRVEDQLGKGMRHSHDSMQQQFQHTSKIVQDVTQRLTELDKTNKQVLDFSSQLQNLQNILKNPKQRGVLGEYWLETLLGNVLPASSYKMQYEVGKDEKTSQKLIADAAIFIRDQVIPIDAKFTLENYNRMMQEHDSERRGKIEKAFKSDVKKRIDETSKYIRPEMGTMNFAFMFIPAEGVYYNLLNAEVGSGINSTNLVQYAFEKHVMLVSPTSFYAYLQTVLMGLRELKLEESTTEIIKRVGELGKHIGAYQDYHERLGKNLGTVVNQYNQSSGELRKVSKDVNKITSGEMVLIETEDISKPEIE